MAKAATRTSLKVCLLSAHGLFLTQFRGVLSGLGIAAETSRLDLLLQPHATPCPFPEAPVYVIDADANLQVVHAAIDRILNRHSNSHMLALAETFVESNAFPLLQQGVKGLLSYAEAPLQLPRALDAVARGGYWVPRSLLSRFVDTILARTGAASRRLPALTKVSPREQEILRWLLGNRSNKEIANELNISERTVKFHVSNLLAKYGVQRRADLIVLAYQGGSGPPAN